MNLFSMLFRGGLARKRGVGGGDLGGSGSPPDFSEVQAAIDAASIVPRSADDSGERLFILSPALGGTFIYSHEEAARRISRAFPELSDAMVGRAVRHLANRVRLRVQPLEQPRRSNWVHGWAERGW